MYGKNARYRNSTVCGPPLAYMTFCILELSGHSNPVAFLLKTNIIGWVPGTDPLSGTIGRPITPSGNQTPSVSFEKHPGL